MSKSKTTQFHKDMDALSMMLMYREEAEPEATTETLLLNRIWDYLQEIDDLLFRFR